MDRHYACFFAKENVDWDQAYQKYREAATNLTSRGELIDLCLELLGELEDQNLILRDSPITKFESWNQGAFTNWDLNVWEDYMQYWTSSDSFHLDTFGAFAFNPTPDDTIGYVYISSLGKGFCFLSFYSATNAIWYCSGAIIDLRMCGEIGSEINAHYASGRFIEESFLAYYRSFRTGPGRNEMGEIQEVLTYRNGAWQFTEPIVLLTGRYTQGPAEQLALLLRTQQYVTVIGDTTAGFANPAISFNLTEDWTLEIPWMVTYSPNGTLLLNSGLAPDIYIPVSEADFAAGVDPVLDTAIEMLVQ